MMLARVPVYEVYVLSWNTRDIVLVQHFIGVNVSASSDLLSRVKASLNKTLHISSRAEEQGGTYMGTYPLDKSV